MNDPGPASAEPDPTQAANVAELAKCLRQVHIQADKPTCRTLEKRTKHKGGPLAGTNLEQVPLRRNKISQMLRGDIFPGKAFMLTFVEQCGVDLSAHPEWRQAWDRLAWLRGHDPTFLQGYEEPQQALADVYRPTQANNKGTARAASEQVVAAELGSDKASTGRRSRADETGTGTRDSPTRPAPQDSSSHDFPRVRQSVKDPSELASIAGMQASTDPEEAEKLARSISDPRWKAAALTNIAGTVAASDPARAERLVQSITQTGHRAFAGIIVATTLASFDPDRAVRLAESITNKMHRDFVLATVAGSLAAWSPDRAERLAQSITDQWRKGYVLATVAKTLTVSNPDRAERLAHSIIHREWKAAAIANIADALTKWDAERAKQLMADAKDIAQSITDERSRARAFDYIARVQQRPAE
jgi:hypothetical protein